MSDDITQTILTRATLPEKTVNDLVRRREELEPALQTVLDSLLIITDNDVDLALGIALMGIEALIAVRDQRG